MNELLDCPELYQMAKRRALQDLKEGGSIVSRKKINKNLKSQWSNMREVITYLVGGCSQEEERRQTS